MQSEIDNKISELLGITEEFIFPESYPHTNKIMWKIKNEYTKYSSETFVLCSVEEGIEKALNLAIIHIRAAKHYKEEANP